MNYFEIFLFAAGCAILIAVAWGLTLQAECRELKKGIDAYREQADNLVRKIKSLENENMSYRGTIHEQRDILRKQNKDIIRLKEVNNRLSEAQNTAE